MMVNNLKKIPQRLARRCSCTPASSVFSSSFQLLRSPLDSSTGAFHSSDICIHLRNRQGAQPITKLRKMIDRSARLALLQDVQWLCAISDSYAIHTRAMSHLQVKDRKRTRLNSSH